MTYNTKEEGTSKEFESGSFECKFTLQKEKVSGVKREFFFKSQLKVT